MKKLVMFHTPLPNPWSPESPFHGAYGTYVEVGSNRVRIGATASIEIDQLDIAYSVTGLEGTWLEPVSPHPTIAVGD